MPYDLERMFRLEANELVSGLTQSLLALEKEPDRGDLIATCFRLAHTLKGAARMVLRTDVSELAHTMEETLATYRESGDPIEPDCVSDLLKVLECIRGDLERPAAAARGERRSAPDLTAERFTTVRVELTAMDALLAALSEARAQLRGLHGVQNQLVRAQRAAAVLPAPSGPSDPTNPRAAAERQRQLAALDELRDSLLHAQRDTESRLGRAEQELAQAHELASTLRLVPVSAMLAHLELAARDAAQLLGKSIALELRGGEVRVEANILSAVQDALLHMVRNAVDHGVESPAERQQCGKDPVGHIRVVVQPRGRRVTFQCSDDGRGIDAAAVREAAVASHFLTQEEAAGLSAHAALQLIFGAGVSTRRAVTEMSGRGVGLDVVRELTTRLHGEVSVQSVVGSGTTLGMTVPISLSSLAVLSMSFAGMTLLLPLDAVRGARRLAHSELVAQPSGQAILYEGQSIPFVPLGALLGVAVAPRARWSVVIAQAGAHLIALGADRIDGSQDVVIKPLPAAAGSQPLFTGAALDAQGDPLLVLDPRGLLERASALLPSQSAPLVRPPRLPILVIDDSLTTRTLEQSILEAAGYEVELADSAEAALSKARQRAYSLFIVDIEMPGMSGVEFTARTRADEKLKRVPVIVVTSLASPAHQERALAAGASAYIVKSEFDQGRFIEKVALLAQGS